MTDASQTDPKVEVTLSRPAYRLGGTVVGLIRVTTTLDHRSPRDALESLQVFMAGHCRLDERWHGSSSTLGDAVWSDFSYADNRTTCFWSSNRIDLLSLQERTMGRWEDVRPRPIQLPGRAQILEEEDDQPVDLEATQLAYTFRVDLPREDSIPPTLVATSCRYYYTVVIRMCSTGSAGKPVWIQTPVRVLTAAESVISSSVPRQHDDTATPTRPVLQAMAHSSGLPSVVVTATELNRWEGRLMVHHRHGAAHSRHIRRHDPQSVQTMRVMDPETGQPACLLTMMGASVLHPGSRIVLKLDFPARGANGASWVPVYQASACLQGEEIAIRQRDGQRIRARSHLFDTAHQRIDPATVESTSLDLILPLSAPCTVKTDRVEIEIRCLVDIVVGGNKDSGEMNYRNLRMEIPCQVVHPSWAWEEKEAEDRTVDLIEELQAREQEKYTDPTDPRSFPIQDIQNELKILSLCMADKCGLKPKTPYQKQLEGTNGSVG